MPSYYYQITSLPAPEKWRQVIVCFSNSMQPIQIKIPKSTTHVLFMSREWQPSFCPQTGNLAVACVIR
jgi:hypothetical protein